MSIKSQTEADPFSWKQMFDDILSPGDFQVDRNMGTDMSQPNPTLSMAMSGGQGPAGAPTPPGMGQQMAGGGLMGMPAPTQHQPMMEGPAAPNAMGPLQGLMGMSRAGPQQQREQMDPLAMMDQYIRGLMNV